MNANDARLTELTTAQAGSAVEDNAPNAPNGPGPGSRPFDLVVEAVAGSAVGSAGTPYKMTLTAVDLTLQAPVAAMSVGPLTQAFNAANGWNLSGGGPDFEKTQVFNIPVPNGVRDHVLQYIGSLVTANGQIVSIAESDPFIVV